MPAVVMILALSVLFLAHAPPLWVRAAGAGAGAGVAAVALRAGIDLLRPSYRQARERGARRIRWLGYLLVGGLAAAFLGAYLVLALVVCGLAELALQRRALRPSNADPDRLACLVPFAAVKGGIGALTWTAFKIGALAFGGGFVIIPLMHGDAVHVYRWMTNSEFLSAVALGQVTPGPVVATVAAVGYAAHGIAGGVLAAAVAFAPSFSFILLGGGRFERLRQNASARAFLDGAGPGAVGAILGAAIPLTSALQEWWLYLVLSAAAVALLVGRRGIVQTLLAAGVTGVMLAFAGAPAP